MKNVYLLMRTDYVKETGKLGAKICEGVYTSKALAIKNMVIAVESLGFNKSKVEVDIADKSVVYRNQYLISRFRIIKQGVNIVPWDNNAEQLRITEKELAG